jgi:hypothetical protein
MGRGDGAKQLSISDAGSTPPAGFGAWFARDAQVGSDEAAGAGDDNPHSQLHPILK